MDRSLMERLAENAAPVVEEGEVSDKLLLHLAAAAAQMNIDVGDKDAVNAFFDQIKALVTSDKAALVTKLKKFAGKDAKAVSKKALAEKPLREGTEGYSLLMMLLGGEDAVGDLVERLNKEDEQSLDLFEKITRFLTKELTLSSGAEEALSRVRGMVSRGKTWDIDLLRNNVFKAANSLGIKLPSGSF